jgi:hypothetical protein
MRWPSAVIALIRPAIKASRASTKGIAMTALQNELAIEFQTKTLETPHPANRNDPKMIRARAPIAATAASPRRRFGLKTKGTANLSATVGLRVSGNDSAGSAMGRSDCIGRMEGLRQPLIHLSARVEKNSPQFVPSIPIFSLLGRAWLGSVPPSSSPRPAGFW